MESSTQHLIAEHLDLLVTAATRYRVLVSSDTAATFAAGEMASAITPTAAGQMLLEHHLAARGAELAEITQADHRRRSERDRAGGGAGGGASRYEHRPVEDFEPVEVIKAAHGLEHLCQSSPRWTGSAAAGLLASILRGATERLPGYAEAPWVWTRAQAPAGVPITLTRNWIPTSPGLRQIETLEELLNAWDDAVLVLLPEDVLDRLPLQLPDRAGVYICAHHSLDPNPGEWNAVQRLGPDAVVVLPAGEAWLREQLRDPVGSYHRSRLYRRPIAPTKAVR